MLGKWRLGLLSLLAGAAVWWLALLMSQSTPAKGDKEEPADVAVYVYPHKLAPKDKLVDGPDKVGKAIDLDGETTLVWVDLATAAKFAHRTEYVLISPKGTRVVKGNWWPVLNGKELFRDGKKTSVDFPMGLSRR
jgi:hypothetical protein